MSDRSVTMPTSVVIAAIAMSAMSETKRAKMEAHVVIVTVTVVAIVTATATVKIAASQRFQKMMCCYLSVAY